ncbi:MAG: GNAT family N-acetyltransferase [Xanthomonadales bacterium]|nr:GNAT family N-acetyltransferase [Xanthomonadales bacterium]
MTRLTTHRLELRPITLDDAPAYWPLVSDPAVQRYTGEAPLGSVADVRDMLARLPLRDYRVHGYGRLACIEKASGTLIGFCGLKYLEDIHEVDIGYRFMSAYWGQGYATESAQAVMQHGKHVLGIDRIIGLVDPENVGSVHVLQKLGLVLESRIRLADYPEELLLYAPPQSSSESESAS